MSSVVATIRPLRRPFWRAMVVAPEVPERFRCRSPMIRSVSSVTTQSMPLTRRLIRERAVGERVVGLFRVTAAVEEEEQSLISGCFAGSQHALDRGPMSGQISAQTLFAGEPRAQLCLIPSVAAYASLQKKVSSGPQAIHIAYRELSMMRTAVIKLCGQNSTGPIGVLRPIERPHPFGHRARSDKAVAAGRCSRALRVGHVAVRIEQARGSRAPLHHILACFHGSSERGTPGRMYAT